MISFLLFLAIMICLLRLTGYMFHIAGRLLGWAMGFVGWIILAGLAVTVFSFALYALPIILLVGVISLATASTI